MLVLQGCINWLPWPALILCSLLSFRNLALKLEFCRHVIFLNCHYYITVSFYCFKETNSRKNVKFASRYLMLVFRDLLIFRIYLRQCCNSSAYHHIPKLPPPLTFQATEWAIGKSPPKQTAGSSSPTRTSHHYQAPNPAHSEAIISTPAKLLANYKKEKGKKKKGFVGAFLSKLSCDTYLTIKFG